MEDDILKQAFHSLNSEKSKELREMVEDMSMIIPSALEIAREIREESIIKGFTREEAFQISKEYALRLVLPHNFV